MLNEIENRIVKPFANVSGVPFEMLSKKLMSNKEANTYPYWLFNSKKPDSNIFELSASEKVVSRHIGFQDGENMPAKDIQINQFAGMLAYGKKFNLYPRLQSLRNEVDYIHYGIPINVWTQKRGEIDYPQLELFCLFLGDCTESWTFEFKGWVSSGNLVLEFPRRKDGEEKFSESKS